MSIEKTIVLTMSYISNQKPVPVEVAKDLVAELCLYRANAKWIDTVLIEVLTDFYAALEKTEGRIENVQGAFEAEDDIFLEAYVHCRGIKHPETVADVKDSLVIVKGGKDEE